MSLAHAAQDPKATKPLGGVSALKPFKLGELFPGLSAAELNEVAETLNGYYGVVFRIYQRLSDERPEIIDELMKNRRMKGKVDSLK
jgi:hypothetical protein